MSAPTVRTVAVAAGFFGISLVVAGTASAMAERPAHEPVGAAIQLTQPEVSTGSVTAPPVTLSAGTVPIEVVAEPIECDDDGTCGTNEVAESAPVTQTTSTTSVARSTSSAECTVPGVPAADGSIDRDTYEAMVDAYQERVAWLAEECGEALAASLPDLDSFDETHDSLMYKWDREHSRGAWDRWSEWTDGEWDEDAWGDHNWDRDGWADGQWDEDAWGDHNWNGDSWGNWDDDGWSEDSWPEGWRDYGWYDSDHDDDRD
ncbi:hypothetical protein ON058_03185 [Demequina sp. B12]|uniref:hypothetical protein n=1 Tax=Demequina sp. B12 TaxID=2992757 RepID=UPI00237BB6BE|nr:hypothetical protein [Demequina sp. B12]MDE0572412.1 hypothetical protein [Demequina sp. B12]